MIKTIKNYLLDRFAKKYKLKNMSNEENKKRLNESLFGMTYEQIRDFIKDMEELLNTKELTQNQILSALSIRLEQHLNAKEVRRVVSITNIPLLVEENINEKEVRRELMCNISNATIMSTTLIKVYNPL